MPGSASERERAHSAEMTGNSQSSACLHAAPSRRPPALSRTGGRRRRTAFRTAGRDVRRGGRTGPWQPTESSASFLPSERAPLRQRIPASNGCTEDKETSCGTGARRSADGMTLSEHKGALALAGRLSARPGLPGHQTIKKETKKPDSGDTGFFRY